MAVRKAFDREKLLREIASDDRKRRRAAIASLRGELRSKRSRRTDAMAAAAAQCRAARDRARAAREAAKEAASRARGVASAARSACELPSDYGAMTSAVAAARERLREEEEAAREIRAIEAAERRRLAGQKTRGPGGARKAQERRSESDDEVRGNLPPELLGLFERVKRQIKGSERSTRTEAFLEYVESHPEEVYEGIDDATDAMIAAHERALRANPAKGPKGPRRAKPPPELSAEESKRIRDAVLLGIKRKWNAGDIQDLVYAATRSTVHEAVGGSSVPSSRTERARVVYAYAYAVMTEKGYDAPPGFYRHPHDTWTPQQKALRDATFALLSDARRWEDASLFHDEPARTKRRHDARDAFSVAADAEEELGMPVQAEAHRIRAATLNPGKVPPMLIELGRLTKLTYRDDGGRRRVLTWGLRAAPILAYEPKKRASLVIVYAAVPRGRASAAATREYSRTHWGEEGAGARVDGDVALEPLTELGPGLSIVYTTQKGGDAAASDYDHEWGEGASGKFTPPRVLVHRCRAPRCATMGRASLSGGTYLVTDRGIVG